MSTWKGKERENVQLNQKTTNDVQQDNRNKAYQEVA